MKTALQHFNELPQPYGQMELHLESQSKQDKG